MRENFKTWEKLNEICGNLIKQLRKINWEKRDLCKFYKNIKTKLKSFTQTDDCKISICESN